MEKCVCGLRVDLFSAFLLPCQHKLCEGCSQVPSMIVNCAMCHIECILREKNTSLQHLIIHIEWMYRNHNRLRSEKEHALKTGQSLRSDLSHMQAEYGRLLQSGIQTGDCETPTAGKRKLSPTQRTSDPRKRPKSPEEVTPTSAGHPAKIFDLESQIASLKLELATSRSAFGAEITILRRCCQEITTKLEDREQHFIIVRNEAERQNKDLQTILDTRAHELSIANNTIVQLQTEGQNIQKHCERLAEKATAYEKFARETKAYYRSRIMKLESMIPGSARRTSNENENENRTSSPISRDKKAPVTPQGHSAEVHPVKLTSISSNRSPIGPPLSAMLIPLRMKSHSKTLSQEIEIAAS